jgi:hypothetical protein
MRTLLFYVCAGVFCALWAFPAITGFGSGFAGVVQAQKVVGDYFELTQAQVNSIMLWSQLVAAVGALLTWPREVERIRQRRRGR